MKQREKEPAAISSIYICISWESRNLTMDMIDLGFFFEKSFLVA